MVSVREFCAKYDVSHQAVYKKIARNKNQLEGHIYKENCFMLDDYAENFLKPKDADSKFFTECEKIKVELADKNAKIDFLQDELSREKSKTEKLINSLDNEKLKTADFEKRLAEENLKNEDLLKTVSRLTDVISEKEEVISELRSANSELSEQLAEKSKKWFKK